MVTHLNDSRASIPPMTVLGSDGWVQWITERTGWRAERVQYSAEQNGLPSLEGVLYLDSRGRLRHPPLCPYLPFNFTTTDTDRSARLYPQWTTVASQFAAEMVRRGIVGHVALPPGILDARPFQWAGLHVQVRYTFTTALPLNVANADKSVRNRMRRAISLGYEVERTDDWEALVGCLKGTEGAKGFSHNLDADALSRAATLMGEDSFRCYVVRNSDGLAVSGAVRLWQPGGSAIAWTNGSLRHHLPNGVAQLLAGHTIEDLATAGATSFDYGGANIETVAAAKSAWGMALTPYLLVSGYDFRHLYRSARSARIWALRRKN